MVEEEEGEEESSRVVVPDLPDLYNAQAWREVDVFGGKKISVAGSVEVGVAF